MKIADVMSYVLKLPADEPYLGPAVAPIDGPLMRTYRHDEASIAQPGGDPGGYLVRPPWRSLYSPRFETVLVQVTADDGTTGWGEALAPVGPEVVAAVVDRLLAPQLRGTEFRVDRGGVRPVIAGLRELMRERGHLVGHQADALAAVDIALWDLAGRLAELPVFALLGGAFRDRVPVYVSGLPRPTDAERAELAAQWAQRGATAIKLHLGHGVDADLASYDAVAGAVADAAPQLRIAVDAHWAYDLPDALRLGLELDRRRALFLEAPLAPEDLDGHRELVARVVTPVAVGETLRNRFEFDAWIAARALRIAQPDVARTGITEAMAVAELAAARHLPVAPHHSVGLGVAVAAGLHLAAAVPAMPYFEYQPSTFEVANRILRTPLAAGPAAVALPTGAGLGVEVDAEIVADLASTTE